MTERSFFINLVENSKNKSLADEVVRPTCTVNSIHRTVATSLHGTKSGLDSWAARNVLLKLVVTDH
jgi:hypothetical protein